VFEKLKRNYTDGSGEVDQMVVSSNYRKDSLICRIISYLMAGRNCWAGVVLLLPERQKELAPNALNKCFCWLASVQWVAKQKVHFKTLIDKIIS